MSSEKNESPSDNIFEALKTLVDMTTSVKDDVSVSQQELLNKIMSLQQYINEIRELIKVPDYTEGIKKLDICCDKMRVCRKRTEIIEIRLGKIKERLKFAKDGR